MTHKTSGKQLFVYGTLAPNRPNHHIMTPIADGVWQPAYVMGKVLPNGYGRAAGYPALILAKDMPDGNCQRIDGFVFSSQDLPKHWQRLDDFEGDGYERVRVMATLATGEMVSADVYALAKSEQVRYWQDEMSLPFV